jgi:hypothetical protein
MRRRIEVTVVMLSLLYCASNSSAQMSHEEEVVRNAYAKLTFMCELANEPVSSGPCFHRILL